MIKNDVQCKHWSHVQLQIGLEIALFSKKEPFEYTGLNLAMM